MNIAVLTDRAMERFGDQPSLVHVSLAGPDTTHTTGELHATSVRLASALRRLGVVPGDRVAVMVPNVPEVTSSYAAISRCGGAIVPIGFLLADPEVSRILADAEPAIVVTSAELYGRVRAAADAVASIRHIVCIDGPTPEGALGLAELLAASDEHAAMVDRDRSDLAMVMYTGGTTGRPKGVMLTHGNLAFAATKVAEVSERENDAGARDVSCSALPMAHPYGVLVWLAGTQLGGRSVMMRWFEPSAWLRCVQRYRCTTAQLVPAMITYLLDHPAAGEHDLSSLRLVNSGAAPLPVQVGRAFEERFGCTVLEGWGLTESVGYGTLNRLGSRKWGSVGRAGPGVDIAVRDADGAALPSGETGELWMRGGHVMAGYWKLPEATEEAVHDGWLRTGDVGYIDDDGFLFIIDRTTDLIIRGGFNVYPRDVEEVLLAHAAVLEAAVVGVPDHSMGQEVRAFVVLKPGAQATEQELLRHCRERLATYKAPRTVVFLDALPKSGVGKVVRRELREASPARDG